MPDEQTEVWESVFGPLSGELATLMGQVTMLAAILEQKLSHVAMSLGTGSQNEYAGYLGDQSVKYVKKRLGLFRTNPGERTASEKIRVFVVDSAAALRRRNDLVHRVWLPVDVEAQFKGHKGRRQVSSSSDWVDWGKYTPTDFKVLIADLGALLVRARVIVADAGSLGDHRPNAPDVRPTCSE